LDFVERGYIAPVFRPVPSLKSSIFGRIRRPVPPAGRTAFLLMLLLTAPSSAAVKAPGDPPIIRTQPIARNVSEGGHAALAVLLAENAPPLWHQWWRNEQPLAANDRVSGTTNFVLNIDTVQIADSGNYFIIVSNTAGAVTSAVVSLVVSQVVFTFTPVGGTGAWLNISGQIGDVYRIEVNTNFSGYRTNGYATNVHGQAQYFDYDPGTGFRQIRARFDRMLPVLYPGEPDAGAGPLTAKAAVPGSLRAYGRLNQVWRFERSANLVHWVPIATVTNTAGWLSFVDPNIDPTDVLPPHRFYRIAPP
jgi:hypothetical protein